MFSIKVRVGKKVLPLAKRFKRKDASGALYKSTTEYMSFFNRKQIFVVRKVSQRGSSYDYWISKTDDSAIIDKSFLRQELFALKK